MSVFISYNSLDEQYAQRLAKVFSLNNIPYWFAPKDIRGGENFADKIANELSRHKANDVCERIDEDYEHLVSSSTELFLLLLSKNSMNSKWVKKELINAIEEETPVLVLQIDNAPIISGFNYILRDVQVIKAYHLNKQGIEQVIQEITNKIHFETDGIVNIENKRFTYQEIGVHPIAEGDPYFIDGKTLITVLSKQCFFLAPPKNLQKNLNVTEYLSNHIFSKKDIVFESSLDEICSQIPIKGLREMFEESRQKIFQQFLMQENGCYYNNKKYGIYNFSAFERTEDISEEPIVRIEFYTTDYFTHRVMKDICKQLTKVDSNYFQRLSYNKIGYARIFFTSLGINLLLMDHGGNVLLTGRSTNVAETYNKHCYSVSVIEGVSQSDYDSYDRRVNIRFAILRGIKEELGIDEHYLLMDSLKLYDVFVNYSNQEFGISCSLELQNDFGLKKDIIQLKGKDETLEVSEKKVVPISQLKSFLLNNRTGMVLQAVYTICVFLESYGIFLIERYKRNIIKNTKFIMSKSGKSGLCGDAYVWGENYIAVIDGATPKSSLLWEGQRGDIFVSHLLADAIADMDKNLSGPEAIMYLNEIIREEYKKRGKEFLSFKPEERLQCSVLIYSVAKNEVWGFGDCMLKINDREFYNAKAGDRLFAALRAFCIQIKMDHCEQEINEIELSNYGRDCILPYLKQYVTLANRDVPFGYDVIDGGNIDPNHVKIYAVQKDDYVVMATDGYPRLFDSLDETEDYLQKSLEIDPICIGILQGTKGVANDDISFDDRTYISFKVI